MELLSHLLKKIVYLIPIVLIFAFLFILIRFTLKSLGITPSLSSITNKEFLPAPRLVNSGKAPTPTDTPTNPTMEELNPWMKNGTYNYNGATSVYTEANSQVRNIKVGNNNFITSGSLVNGTARGNFFVNGKFLVVLINKNNQVLAASIAKALPTDVSTTWIPWEAKFASIPAQGNARQECTLILQNQNPTSDPNLTKVIRLPVTCY